MDYTIELWTIHERHCAECTCGWQRSSIYQPVLESHVKNHRLIHAENGDATEVV